jgi:hypothetical protein
MASPFGPITTRSILQQPGESLCNPHLGQVGKSTLPANLKQHFLLNATSPHLAHRIASRSPLMAPLQQRTESLCKPQFAQRFTPVLQTCPSALISPHLPHSVTSNAGLCSCGKPGGSSLQPQNEKQTAHNAHNTTQDNLAIANPRTG